MDTIVFYITIFISIMASFIIVSRKNPVYSAVFMVTFFIMMAIDFLILRAPFLAVIQVLVYGGAIMVLYLFVIMLLNLKPEELKEEVTVKRKVVAFLASTGLFCLLAGAIRSSSKVSNAPFLTDPLPETLPEEIRNAGEVSAISEELFQNHGLAFELTSVLILIAIIGAIFLTKKRELKHGTQS